MTSLSPAQRDLLEAVGQARVVHELFSGRDVADGRARAVTASVARLHAAGLIEPVSESRYTDVWVLTPAGRAALAEEER